MVCRVCRGRSAAQSRGFETLGEFVEHGTSGVENVVWIRCATMCACRVGVLFV